MRLPPLPAVPTRLPRPDPGWMETTDVVVVGSGIAGLTTALHLREAGLHVTVVTKETIDDGSTQWAQGGIAAVLDPLDTPDAHLADTLAAGAGLCDPAAVRVLVAEGPARIRDLIRVGTQFDRNQDGSLRLTREGGHRANRIVHAGGDATGAEVQRALRTAVLRDPWIRVFDHALVVDLITGPAPERRARGVILHVLGEGTEEGVGAILAGRAVVLATGGIGQIFAATTNPTVSTGDGLAAALRAGAAVTDLEFVQFHPTALFPPDAAGREGNPDGNRPLITEALRGEGAHLVDQDGKRFLLGAHEMAELAPRDVVAKACYQQMRQAGVDHVYLDARHLGGEFLAERFPTITAACARIGVDPGSQLIPVAPAAHYASGGVRTDLDGRTTVPGLYACGEVACTGVHGANRLASNSLLEGLVFARRIATAVVTEPEPESPPDPDRLPDLESPSADLDRALGPDDIGHRRWALQQAMTAGAGVLRSADSLSAAGEQLRQIAGPGLGGGTAAWEYANLLTVAATLLAAGFARQETRGSHWREDRPDPDDAWLGHLRGALRRDGSLSLTWEPA